MRPVCFHCFSEKSYCYAYGCYEYECCSPSNHEHECEQCTACLPSLIKLCGKRNAFKGGLFDSKTGEHVGEKRLKREYYKYIKQMKKDSQIIIDNILRINND